MIFYAPPVSDANDGAGPEKLLGLSLPMGPALISRWRQFWRIHVTSGLFAGPHDPDAPAAAAWIGSVPV